MTHEEAVADGAGEDGDKVGAAIRRRMVPGRMRKKEENKAALKFSCKSMAASDTWHYSGLNLRNVPWENNLIFDFFF